MSTIPYWCSSNHPTSTNDKCPIIKWWQNISGGQKQRLAIVRAMSNKPEVVIFDEATSNIDSLTERKIYKRLKEARVSQIIITHRLKAVEDADRIYVIDDGNIVEMGKHEKLMEQQGLYYLLQNDKE